MGKWGTVLSKIEVGTAHVSAFPNILRSRPTIMRCEAKVELTEKGVKEDIFCSEIVAFGQEFGQEKDHVYMYVI